jgi:hypothetical protein
LEWLERYQTLKKPLLAGHVSENRQYPCASRGHRIRDYRLSLWIRA